MENSPSRLSPIPRNHEFEMINGLYTARIIELPNEMLKENLDEIRHAIMNEI
jgi:hypothetical protein